MNCLSNISSIDQNVKELLYYNFEALKKKKNSESKRLCSVKTKLHSSFVFVNTRTINNISKCQHHIVCQRNPQILIRYFKTLLDSSSIVSSHNFVT